MREGFQYNNIQVLNSTHSGLTVFISKKNEFVTFSKDKFFNDLAKDYPIDSMVNLRVDGMVYDAFDGKALWKDVATTLKERKLTIALSTYYKLWKEDKTTFNTLKTDPDLGWGKFISENGAKFLCSVQEEEFLNMVCKECGINTGNGDIWIYAIKTNARLFIKHAI